MSSSTKQISTPRGHRRLARGRSADRRCTQVWFSASPSGWERNRLLEVQRIAGPEDLAALRPTPGVLVPVVIAALAMHLSVLIVSWSIVGLAVLTCFVVHRVIAQTFTLGPTGAVVAGLQGVGCTEETEDQASCHRVVVRRRQSRTNEFFGTASCVRFRGRPQPERGYQLLVPMPGRSHRVR